MSVIAHLHEIHKESILYPQSSRTIHLFQAYANANCILAQHLCNCNSTQVVKEAGHLRMTISKSLHQNQVEGGLIGV